MPGVPGGDREAGGGEGETVIEFDGKKRRLLSAGVRAAIFGWLLGVAGTGVGSLLNANLAARHSREEAKRQGFYKLVGLRDAYCYAKQEQLRYTFFHALAQVTSASKEAQSWTEAQRQSNGDYLHHLGDQELAALHHFMDLHRELIENLGAISVAFKDDKITTDLAEIANTDAIYDIKDMPVDDKGLVPAAWQMQQNSRLVEESRVFCKPINTLMDELADKLHVPRMNLTTPTSGSQ